jgi:hypothetical protein
LRLREALAEEKRGQTHRAGWADKLERLGKGDADFANGDVIQDVRETDAGDRGNDEDDVHLRADFERRRDFPKRQREREEQRGGNEADHAETPSRPKPGGGPFHENAIKRPAETRGEGDGEALDRSRSRLPSFLKADDADGAEQTENGPDLKLPLANDPSFFGEKDQCEQSGEDDRGATEDSVDARSHVEERDGLSDLMDDIRQRRDEANQEKPPVQARAAVAEPIKDEG